MAIKYYKIKKEWNGGKWDKTQKGAYTTYAIALNNFTDEMKQEGYKIFDPNGIIVYPHHELTDILLNDGIDLGNIGIPIVDKYFGEETKDIHHNFIKYIIEQYHDKITELKTQYSLIKEPVIVSQCSGIDVYRIPINRLSFRYIDSQKKNITKYQSYFNLGFFGGFSELGNYFTLPSGNLIADINLEEQCAGARKYLDSRTINGKFSFSACENGAQFARKKVTTIALMKNGTYKIYNTDDIKAQLDYNDISYAVSGVPIKLNGYDPLKSEILAEGWDAGTLRANTTHSFLATKEDDNNHIYYFICNIPAGKNVVTKIRDDMKSLEFDNIIKLDGGGSSYFKYNGTVKATTGENRQICTIGCII